MKRLLLVLTIVAGMVLVGTPNRCRSLTAHPIVEEQGSSATQICRGDRFGEVLLIHWKVFAFEAEVWTTKGLNDCPLTDWQAISIPQIQAETGALQVIVNGPRLSLPNEIKNTTGAETRRFGDLELQLDAWREIEPGLSHVPYLEQIVAQTATFVFAQGEQIFELTSPEGFVYVMRSMAQFIEPELSLQDLPELDQKLSLPRDWSYDVRTLDADLVLSSHAEAVLVHDNLCNTYQRREPAASRPRSATRQVSCCPSHRLTTGSAWSPVSLNSSQQEEALSGTWLHESNDESRARRLAAIDEATASLNALIRGRARDRIRAATNPPDEIELLDRGEQVTIRRDQERITLTTDGRPADVRMEGRSGRVSARREAGRLIVSMQSGSGRQTSTYRLSDDERQLIVEVQLSNDRLPEPIRFSMTYTRR